MSIIHKSLAEPMVEDVARLRAWTKSEIGKAYMTWWQRAVDPLHFLQHGKTALPPAIAHLVEARALTGDTLAPSVKRNFIKGYEKAVHGPMYYVTPEMGDQAALRMIRQTEAIIHPHELISPHGIVFLPVTNDACFQKQERYVGQEDITPAVAWTTNGSSVTLYWICDQTWNSLNCLLNWLDNKGFWTTDPYDPHLVVKGTTFHYPSDKSGIWSDSLLHEQLNILLGACQDADMWPYVMNKFTEAWASAFDLIKDPQDREALGLTNSSTSVTNFQSQRLLPYHYWSATINSPRGERLRPLLRPDQDGAVKLHEDDGQNIYWNENGKSIKTHFRLDEEAREKYLSDMWFMVAYACEIIRMLGEDFKLSETVMPAQTADRSTQRKLQKRGIDKKTPLRVYTLRKPVEEGLRREGRFYTRGPLTTRHHRSSHWRGNKGHAGDLTCRHIFRPHKDDFNWRVCETCERIEHQVTDAIVGPEGAPFIQNKSIGVLRR